MAGLVVTKEELNRALANMLTTYKTFLDLGEDPRFVEATGDPIYATLETYHDFYEWLQRGNEK